MTTVTTGTVVHGAGDGAKLGFPTANLSFTESLSLPYGVYACVATIDGQHYNGVLHWGPRAVFGETTPQLEVHLFDFAQTIYGKIVKVEIHDFIRDTKSFPSVDALIVQIQKDCDEAKKLLKPLAPNVQEIEIES